MQNRTFFLAYIIQPVESRVPKRPFLLMRARCSSHAVRAGSKRDLAKQKQIYERAPSALLTAKRRSKNKQTSTLRAKLDRRFKGNIILNF